MTTYICPHCKTEQTRRTDKCCPNCWTEVKIYHCKDGTSLWVRVNDDAPPTALVKHWMNDMSARLTEQSKMKIVFSIHPVRQRGKYMRELAQAENLLMQAEWDIELAKAALSAVVKNSHKAPSTLAWVGDEYAVQLAIATAKRNETTVRLSQDYTTDLLDAMENVWE